MAASCSVSSMLSPQIHCGWPTSQSAAPRTPALSVYSIKEVLSKRIVRYRSKRARSPRSGWPHSIVHRGRGSDSADPLKHCYANNYADRGAQCAGRLRRNAPRIDPASRRFDATVSRVEQQTRPRLARHYVKFHFAPGIRTNPS